MSLTTLNPASFENPDSGQAGTIAVTTPSNTGHASTTAQVIGTGQQTKSCRWFGFPASTGQIISKTLKIDHTSSGTLAGISRSNTFDLQYTLNGGGAWLSAVHRVDFTALQGPTTFSVALAVGQDLTQVQVRDTITADTLPDGGNVTCVVTIANIKIEVVAVDQPAPVWVS